MRPVALLMVLSLGLPACGRSSAGRRCPKGTSLIEAKSKPPSILYCQDDDPRTRRALWLELYPDGARRQECSYVGDRPEGAYRALREDGRLRLQGTFAGGRRNGAWQQFDEQGSLSGEATYRDDTLVAGAPIGASVTCRP